VTRTANQKYYEVQSPVVMASLGASSSMRTGPALANWQWEGIVLKSNNQTAELATAQ